MQTRFAPSFVVVCLLLAIGIVVSLVLWATIRPDDPEPPTSTVAAAEAGAAASDDDGRGRRPGGGGGPIQIAALASYDPPVDGGNGEENDDLVDDAAADGDPATNWTTECYTDEYMGKAGVGVVMTLSAPASGTISFDVGSAPYVVDVFATARRADPAPDRSVGGTGGASRRHVPRPPRGAHPGSGPPRARLFPSGG